MANPKLMAFSDAELEIQLNDILEEQERRKAVLQIPNQIQELKSKFLEQGGDPSLLGT